VDGEGDPIISRIMARMVLNASLKKAPYLHKKVKYDMDTPFNNHPEAKSLANSLRAAAFFTTEYLA
jgi:hypothetical protein